MICGMRCSGVVLFAWWTIAARTSSSLSCRRFASSATSASALAAACRISSSARLSRAASSAALASASLAAFASASASTTRSSAAVSRVLVIWRNGSGGIDCGAVVGGCSACRGDGVGDVVDGRCGAGVSGHVAWLLLSYVQRAPQSGQVKNTFVMLLWHVGQVKCGMLLSW